MRIAVALLIVGCQGESVAEAVDSGKASAEASADAGDTGACDDVVGNLVPNGSFEAESDWRTPVTLVDGGADHCARWARFDAAREWDATSVRIPLTGVAGAVYEFGASVQRLDDNAAEGDVFLIAPSGGPEKHVFRALPSKGAWVRFEGSLTLTGPVDSLTIGVGANAMARRSLGIDRVWLRKK